MSAEEPKVVFLCGSLRAGTTILRILLQNHDSIGGKGEFDFLFDPLSADGGLAAARELNIDRYRDCLKQNRVFVNKGVDVRGSTVAESIVGMAEDCRLGKPVLLLTIHRNFLTALELFPNARFLHILRDPRDCALSSIDIGFSGNAYYGTDHWIRAETSWRLLEQKADPAHLHEVRYEDLFAAPEAELRKICEFIGVEYQPAMAERPHPTYGTPNASQIQAWKRKASPGDVRLVELRAGTMMKERGYEPVTPDLAPPSRIELASLKWGDRIGRNRPEIDIFGWPLWSALKMSRLDPTGLLRRAISAKLNDAVKPRLR